MQASLPALSHRARLQGQFRVVQPDVVLADIASRSRPVPGTSPLAILTFSTAPRTPCASSTRSPPRIRRSRYDVTIKIEHLLKHRDLLPRLRDTGCLFVTSAVESLDDRVLAILDKGHTRADFLNVASLCREDGLALVPTFVAFHPWTTLDGYCDLLDTIETLDLVTHVAPIQLAIRLLIPEGSRMLEVDDLCSVHRTVRPSTLSYPWVHPDPKVDALHADVTRIVGGRLVSDRRAGLRGDPRSSRTTRAGLRRPQAAAGTAIDASAIVPYMNEPWYCCAEPNPEQLRIV